MNERANFVIDSHGAYVVALVDSKGEPVLFERSEIDGKTRGGSHVGLPNFGPDAASRLVQHGFGRDSQWQIVSTDGELEARLTVAEEGYDGLLARIVYSSCRASAFETTLELLNTGDRAMAIAPGFHPYIAVDPESIELDGQLIELGDFSEPHVFSGRTEMVLQSGGRTITVSSETLQTFVVWSDGKGPYLCIEPTLYGLSFNSDDGETFDVLQPGKMRRFSYRIDWM